jgi:hypothetical protein
MTDLQPHHPSTDSDALLRRQARKRVEMKMGFLVHLTVFVLVNGGLFLLNALGLGHGRWHTFPLWGWGLGLAIHGVVTLVSLQGQGLRQRMLEKEMELLRRQR